MIKFAVLAVLIVLAIESAIGLVIYFSIDSWADRGTFGDMFGAANTLFSGLAFCGVIYAILMQKKELSLQRKELNLTRKELKRTADTASDHILHNRNEATKSELYRSIVDIDRKIKELSEIDQNFHIQTTRRTHTLTLKQILYDSSFHRHSDVLPKFDIETNVNEVMEYVETEDGSIDPGKAEIVTALMDIANYLRFLGKYLLEYDDLSDNRAFSLFYRELHKICAERLIERGFNLGKFWETNNTE